MTPFDPKIYGTPLKRLLQEDFKLKADTRALLCSIMYEINESFVKACVTKPGKPDTITPRFIQDAIRKLIPNDLRKYAFAAGSNEIFNYSEGLIRFREPKPLGVFETNTIRKGLNKLLSRINPEVTLSRRCTTIIGIMQKLTKHLVGQLVSTIKHDNEESLENMRCTLKSILGDELFEHAQGHAETNLSWYKSDLLDFPLKRLLSIEPEVIHTEEDKIYLRYIEKLVSSQFSATLTKDTTQQIYNNLRQIMIKMVEEANQISEENTSVTHRHMHEVLQKLFPRNTYYNALAQAQANVMNYSSGFLKYDYGRVAEVESLTRVPSILELIPPKTITINFRAGLRPLMQDMEFLAGKGSVSLLNNILNGIASGVVQKCSQLENNVVTGNDILMATSEVFPEQLRDHALARIDTVRTRGNFTHRVLSQLNLHADPRTQEDSLTSEGFIEDTGAYQSYKMQQYQKVSTKEHFYSAIDYTNSATESRKFAESKRPDYLGLDGNKAAVEDEKSGVLKLDPISIPDVVDQKNVSGKHPERKSKESGLMESKDVQQNTEVSNDGGVNSNESWYGVTRRIFWLDIRPYEFWK